MADVEAPSASLLDPAWWVDLDRRFTPRAVQRDEAAFAEPFRFDIRRDPNPHLAFGQGTHFCLGASLARTELRLLFGALTRRWANLRVLTPPDIEPNVFAGAVRRFDLAFDPRRPTAPGAHRRLGHSRNDGRPRRGSSDSSDEPAR